ncbi:MAG: YkgJ family cysteine cluster protein [Thermoplasmata archaeon]|nr:YkgJ family cysteine cluster protein [Thermoplasmata archaeon]
MASVPPAVDFRLLEGFGFACRPDCALCCYGSPAIAPDERERLLTIRPEAEFRPAAHGFDQIPCRPNGGACTYLAEERCEVRPVRPFPCRSFPVGVHIGNRLQATLVLGCPGVDLGPLASWPPRRIRPSRGLDEERASIEKETLLRPVKSWQQEAERRLRSLTRELPVEPELVDAFLRIELRPYLASLPIGELLPWEPPDAHEGLDDLPLFYDPQHGRVAVAGTETGWELFTIEEGGGVGERLGEFLPPDVTPELDSGARGLLDGYLRYVLARDHTLWAVYEETPKPRSTTELAEGLLQLLNDVAATVIARGAVRCALRGESAAELTVQHVEDGIRATDAELLDLPTLGRIL